MNTLRRSLLTVALLVGLVSLAALPVSAQTALNSTTLSAAITETQQYVPLTSSTNVALKDILFIDREAIQVNALSGNTVTAVTRGVGGTVASPHVTTSLVYTGPRQRFYGGVKPGACTRTSEQFLPHIVLPAGEVWDCPVGAGIWTLYNSPDVQTARSQFFDIDNGAGTTIDAALIRPARPIVITACRIVYQGATTGTIAAGNAKVGITVGGAEVVAATAYANAATVGATTAMVVVAGYIPAGTPVLVRHTGVAATAAGEAVVECDYRYL